MFTTSAARSQSEDSSSDDESQQHPVPAPARPAPVRAATVVVNTTTSASGGAKKEPVPPAAAPAVNGTGGKKDAGPKTAAAAPNGIVAGAGSAGAGAGGGGGGGGGGASNKQAPPPPTDQTKKRPREADNKDGKAVAQPSPGQKKVKRSEPEPKRPDVHDLATSDDDDGTEKACTKSECVSVKKTADSLARATAQLRAASTFTKEERARAENRMKTMASEHTRDLQKLEVANKAENTVLAERYKAQIAEFTATVGKLTDERNAAETSAKDAKDNLSAANIQLDQLRLQLASDSSAIARKLHEAQKAVAELKRDNQALSAKCTAPPEVAAAERKLEALQVSTDRTISELRVELDASKKAVSSQREENTKLAAQCTVSDGHIGAKDKEIASLKSRAAKLEKEATTLQGTLDEAEETVTELEGKLKQQTTDRATLIKQVESFAPQILAYRGQIDAAKKTIDERDEQLRQLKDKLSAQKATSDTFKEEGNCYQQQITELKDQLALCTTSRNDAFASKIKELEAALCTARTQRDKDLDELCTARTQQDALVAAGERYVQEVMHLRGTLNALKQKQSDDGLLRRKLAELLQTTAPTNSQSDAAPAAAGSGGGGGGGATRTSPAFPASRSFVSSLPPPPQPLPSPAVSSVATAPPPTAVNTAAPAESQRDGAASGGGDAQSASQPAASISAPIATSTPVVQPARAEPTGLAGVDFIPGTPPPSNAHNFSALNIPDMTPVKDGLSADPPIDGSVSPVLTVSRSLAAVASATATAANITPSVTNATAPVAVEKQKDSCIDWFDEMPLGGGQKDPRDEPAEEANGDEQKTMRDCPPTGSDDEKSD
jgi:hypothetical protein